MKKIKGFTLIELIVVIVIIGILAAIAIPKYIDLQSDALSAAKAGMSGSVKSSLAMALAENKAYPTVTTLATYVHGGDATAVAGGIQVTINGTNYTVPTYTDNDCTAADVTTAVGDTVKCVGDIP